MRFAFHLDAEFLCILPEVNSGKMNLCFYKSFPAFQSRTNSITCAKDGLFALRT